MSYLPHEILYRIFVQFECTIPFANWEQESMADIECPPPRELIALSQVCRQFHAAARPLLYRTLAFAWRVYGYEKFMDLFMRTLCTEPHLGSIIQYLHVDGFFSRPETKELLTQALPTANSLDKRQMDWLERLGSRGNNVLRLIILAPRLRLLDCGRTTSAGAIGAYLSGRQDVEDGWLAMNLDEDSDEYAGESDDDDGESNSADSGDEGESNESAVVPPNQQDEATRLPPDYPLAELREVRFRHGFGNGLKSICYIEGVLLHPGIQTLRLFAYSWIKDDVKGMKWGHPPSNLTTLQLKSCLVDATGLKDILRRCRRLRHLHIVLATVCGFDSWVRFNGADEEVVHLGKMGRVLRQYAQSIESLEFDSIAIQEYYDVDGYLGPFKELKRLRHLKMSVEELGSFDDVDDDDLKERLRAALPSALESIHIRNYEGDGRLYRMLLMDEYFSSLRKVEIEASKSNNPKSLIVPGWTLSERTDKTSRDEAEEGESEPETIFIFSTVFVFSRDTDAQELEK